MTQEEKDLLLKDLSARIPYGVKICYIFNGEECVSTIEKIDAFCYIWDNYDGCYHVREIKPYLFPLSSMTEEQFTELKNETDLDQHPNDLELVEWENNYKTLEFYLEEVPSDVVIEVFDWLNKNHFDYRGLIEKGLAIDATGLNVY